MKGEQNGRVRMRKREEGRGGREDKDEENGKKGEKSERIRMRKKRSDRNGGKKRGQRLRSIEYREKKQEGRMVEGKEKEVK